MFTEKSHSERLARRVAEETGATLIGGLYTGSLGEEGGEAGTYIDLMRYNTTTIVEAVAIIMTATTSVPPLAAEAITVEFGGIKVLDSVSFNAGPGCIMGVVGPNGAGKSTLFNVITALQPPTSGEVLIHGKSLNDSRGVVAYVPQYERVNSRSAN